MTTQLSHLPDEIKISDDLYLRAKNENSYDEFAKVVVRNIDHLSPWMPWAINAPDESSIEHYKSAPEKKQDNQEANWDIVFNEKLVGAIGVHKREETGTILEIGYWLDKDSTGQGIVTKCVKKVTDVIFNQTDAKAIEIGCDKQNEKSAAVAVRSGYNFDRETGPREHCPQIEVCLMFILTRDQWSKEPKIS